MTDPVDSILPAYNAEEFIAQAIQSVLDQVELNKLIVIDDGSTDNTLSIAEGSGSSVVTITGPNEGVSSARNKGIKQISSDWVQFVDADDMLTPQTIQKRLGAARAQDADVVVTDWAEFENDHQIESGAVKPKIADWDRMKREGSQVACATSFWAPPAAVLYHRRIVEKVGFFRSDLDIVEDARFLFDAARSGARFAHAPHVGAYYRVSPNSLSRSSRTKFWLSVFKNGQQIEDLWRSDGQLNAHQDSAITQLYRGCANMLIREGHERAFDAIAHFKERGGAPDAKMWVGSWVLKLFGARAVRTAFKLGQMRPKPTAGRR